MVSEISLNTPLAEALNAVIQPKLVEVGWSTGGVDDSALSEYIILMLVNGKTQDQIAAELSGDLLNLGPDDPGAIDFSRWLFERVDSLDQQLNGGQLQSVAEASGALDGNGHGVTSMDAQIETGEQAGGGAGGGAALGQDTEMGDTPSAAAEVQIPTGPKSMRNGHRNKRLFGQLSKAMDRSSSDAVLHRVRPQQGTERVNSHSREPPKGPRINTNRNQRVMNGRIMGGMPPGGMANGGPAMPMMNMTAQQQMQLFAMYEEQARMMSQILSPQQQQQMFLGSPGFSRVTSPSTFGTGFPPQPQPLGRSLFERVEPRPSMGNKGHDRHQPSRGRNPSDLARSKQIKALGFQGLSKPNTDPTSSMEVEVPQPSSDADPSTTVCKFNLACTKEDCLYAHQSSAAPPGTTIDVTDECSFGAACKNRKCVARHPSPATKSTHQAEQDCKFFPNCANPTCPFRHPTMPLCRNGADCTRPGCKFTHVQTACKYNPCLNATCPFKHIEGQKRGAFHDKVWVANGIKRDGHVSERKFVNENMEEEEEELIIPASSNPGSQLGAELVT